MKFVDAKTISTKHATLGEIELKVEAPQLDSLDELSSFAGGDEKALKWVNAAIMNDAKTVGRTALRQIPEGGNLEEHTPRIQALVKGFTPETSDGREVRAKKVAAFDQFAALLQSGGEVSREALLAMLEKAK